MSILFETSVGDFVVDLDIKGSPALCANVLKLAKARYYTSTLIYNVQAGRFCQMGDPRGDGSGGSSIYALVDTAADKESRETPESSTKRFLRSEGRHLSPEECSEKGRVVATEMNGVPHTIGSQFLITTESGPKRALDGYSMDQVARTSASKYLSLGVVVKDDDGVLEKINAAYCDPEGRPYADIRIVRALIVHDPYPDPEGMEKLLDCRSVILPKIKEDGDWNALPSYPPSLLATDSPDYDRPQEECVEIRIQASELENVSENKKDEKEQEEELLKKEDKSRAVVLEMLGDLPSADIKAPDNILFVCKLNPVTDDEDLELIFSRFDPQCKAEIIRDPETGASLQYAFVEFGNKQQCAEAYFKMNNALIDDRRIKVDFSQSVAKIWNKYAQRTYQPKGSRRYGHDSSGSNGDRKRSMPSPGSNKRDTGNRPQSSLEGNRTNREDDDHRRSLRRHENSHHHRGGDVGRATNAADSRRHGGYHHHSDNESDLDSMGRSRKRRQRHGDEISDRYVERPRHSADAQALQREGRGEMNRNDRDSFEPSRAETDRYRGGKGHRRDNSARERRRLRSRSRDRDREEDHRKERRKRNKKIRRHSREDESGYPRREKNRDRVTGTCEDSDSTERRRQRRKDKSSNGSHHRGRRDERRQHHKRHSRSRSRSK